MTALIAWLRATINAEKATAQAAHGPNWNAEKRDVAYGDEWIMSALTQADAAHIVLHDPQNTIDRCEADLAELDQLDAMPHYSWDGRPEYGCPMADPDAWTAPVCNCGRDAFVDRMTRVKAYGRRRQPGYQPAWAPEGMTA